MTSILLTRFLKLSPITQVYVAASGFTGGIGASTLFMETALDRKVYHIGVPLTAMSIIFPLGFLTGPFTMPVVAGKTVYDIASKK